MGDLRGGRRKPPWAWGGPCPQTLSPGGHRACPQELPCREQFPGQNSLSLGPKSPVLIVSTWFLAEQCRASWMTSLGRAIRPRRPGWSPSPAKPVLPFATAALGDREQCSEDRLGAGPTTVCCRQTPPIHYLSRIWRVWPQWPQPQRPRPRWLDLRTAAWSPDSHILKALTPGPRSLPARSPEAFEPLSRLSWPELGMDNQDRGITDHRIQSNDWIFKRCSSSWKRIFKNPLKLIFAFFSKTAIPSIEIVLSARLLFVCFGAWL